MDIVSVTRLGLYGGSRGDYGEIPAQPPAQPTILPSVTGIKIMMTLNKNEYGIDIYARLGEDVSTATDYTLILDPYIGDEQIKTVSDGVSLGTTSITVDDQTYIANQYISYTLKDGDLDQSGLWRLRGTATMSATKKLIGDYDIISVLD